MGRIDFEKLRQLESLLDDEVINEEEYNTKVAQLCSVPINKSTLNKEEPLEKKESALSTILPIMLCVLAALCMYFYYSMNEWKVEGSYYKDRYIDIASELSSYKTALNDYYLDNAVIVVEGDNTHYHRFNCDTLPETYNYYLYNVDAAKNYGYKKCPTCFGDDKEHYVKHNF